MGLDGRGRQVRRVGLQGLACHRCETGPDPPRAVAELPLHLTYQAMAVMWTGDFAGAASLIAELDAAATGTRFPPYTLLRLRALQGREAEASAAIANAIEQFGGTAVRAH